MHGLKSCSYDISRFEADNVLYIKLALDQTKSYVGSTIQGMLVRVADRRRSFASDVRDRRTEPALGGGDEQQLIGSSYPS